MDIDNGNQSIGFTKVLDAHPEATKHTVPDGQKNIPVDSPLIRREISKHIEETWIPTRRGPFPIDTERSRPGATVIFSNSMTCGDDLNAGRFREISSVIQEGGAILPIHVLSHSDEQRYLGKVNQERASPKLTLESDNDEGQNGYPILKCTQ